MPDNPLDDDLHETMSRFKAATNARPLELPEFPKPTKVLVAFDQSNQDEFTANVATRVCKWYGAKAVIMLASPGVNAATQRAHLEAMQTKMEGVESEFAPEQDDDDPAEQILDAKKESGAEFIIMDAPYGEDIGRLGRDSVGSTAERVLAKAAMPVLFVRQAHEDVLAIFENPLIKLHVREPEGPLALAKAFSLCGPNSSYSVLFVIDADAMAEAMALLGQDVDQNKLTEETLLADAQAAAGSLVAAAQRWAAANDASLSVSFKFGIDPELTTQTANEGKHLVVVPCPADRNSAAYSRALTVLRLSSVPVLMV